MLMRICVICLCFILTAAASAQPPDRNGFGPGAGPGGEYGPPPPGPGGAPPNAMFDAIDTDGDGTLTMRELRKAVAALKQLDTDKDGKITREEALGGRPGDPTAMVDRLMENDRNGDGKLSEDEIPRPMVRRLAGADTNGDGAIDRNELTAAIENAPNQFSGPGGSPQGGMGSAPGGFGASRGRFGGPAGPDLMQYDRNGDGQLSVDEVPTQMMGLLRGADRNGSGSVDAQELQAIQQRINERVRGQRPLPPGVTVGPQGVERKP